MSEQSVSVRCNYLLIAAECRDHPIPRASRLRAFAVIAASSCRGDCGMLAVAFAHQSGHRFAKGSLLHHPWTACRLPLGVLAASPGSGTLGASGVQKGSHRWLAARSNVAQQIGAASSPPPATTHGGGAGSATEITPGSCQPGVPDQRGHARLASALRGGRVEASALISPALASAPPAARPVGSSLRPRATAVFDETARASLVTRASACEIVSCRFLQLTSRQQACALAQEA